MLARTKILLVVGLFAAGCFLTAPNSAQAQTYAVGPPAPVGYVTVHRHSYYTPVVPVQTYTTYYAPQVPVVTTPVATVPTVSAYYVPTAVVTQPVVTPVYYRVRRPRILLPARPVVVARPVYYYGW